MDIIESALAPMHDYFDLHKNVMVIIIVHVIIMIRKNLDIFFLVMNISGFHEKIIKLYFNIEYTKLFYLSQKEIKLNKNIHNIYVLIDIFMNLYDNSNIDCNKKIKINYMIYIKILFLMNSFIIINIKIIFSSVIINKVKFITNTRQIVSCP